MDRTERMGAQIRNKTRVTDHGEVFTADREVQAMLDLVNPETRRIDSRFLEPACGSGNFLVAVLRRKLEVVRRRHGRSEFAFSRDAFTALSSLYGVDLLADNVEECRRRLQEAFLLAYREASGKEPDARVVRAARFILDRNVLWGDALTMRRADGTDEPIVFTEWTPVNGRLVKRREYVLAHMLDQHPMDGDNLFSDLGERAFVPRPVREHPLTDFLEIGE